MKNRILVIGIGSDFRCDDRAGLAVARFLREKNIPGVEVIEESGEGTALMERWKDAEYVFLIDAVSSDSPPGTIHRVDVQRQKIPKSFFHSSTHQFGVAEAIELSRVLNQLPPHLIIYGIEGTNFSMGIEITPTVSDAGLRAVDLVIEEIRAIQV
jgi:hydrogenase maturation protease